MRGSEQGTPRHAGWPRVPELWRLASVAMRSILVTLFVLAFESVRADDKLAAPDFSQYPQTAAFKYCIGRHTDGVWHLQRKNLLMITESPAGGRCALQYFVTESGQESGHRNVYDIPGQVSHGKQITETNFTALRSAIRQLPAESMSPPVERLVIVSFRAGTNWITRSYDYDALPEPMRQIYDIVGERSESRKDK